MSELNEKIKKLQVLVDNAESIVFFGGAGVSTESSIPDFRSENGLYQKKGGLSPEYLLSHTCFERQTEEFFDYYRNNLMPLSAKPNACHKKLVELEEAGKLLAIITQNVDGLHQAAGSKTVYELHGSIYRNYCVNCGKSFDAQFVKNSVGAPMCECGGIVKPDVVLYEEDLNDKVIVKAIGALNDADLLIVAGTSLAVYPASGLIKYYRGENLVIINKSPTPYDRQADLVISDSVGAVLDKIEVR